MAKLTNIAIPLVDFFHLMKPLIEKKEMNIYIQNRFNEIELVTTKLQLNKIDSFFESNLDSYDGFFITSEDISDTTLKNGISFYSDKHVKYAIEGRGGRIENNNLELVVLRLLSKEPEKKAATFSNDIGKFLKKNQDTGKGFEGSFHYQRMFYDKGIVHKYTIWSQLKHKTLPLKPLNQD